MTAPLPRRVPGAALPRRTGAAVGRARVGRPAPRWSTDPDTLARLLAALRAWQP